MRIILLVLTFCPRTAIWRKTCCHLTSFSVFQRLSTSWGDQMNSVLQNAILVFLESDRPGTLADVRRFLIEPCLPFRVSEIGSRFRIALLLAESLPPALRQQVGWPDHHSLDTFLAPKPIRYMVSQPENRLDFADIMDSGKIFWPSCRRDCWKGKLVLLGALLVGNFNN